MDNHAEVGSVAQHVEQRAPAEALAAKGFSLPGRATLRSYAMRRESALNLVDQPWRIMSIGMRDWAYEF